MCSANVTAHARETEWNVKVFACVGVVTRNHVCTIAGATGVQLMYYLAVVRMQHTPAQTYRCTTAYTTVCLYRSTALLMHSSCYYSELTTTTLWEASGLACMCLLLHWPTHSTKPKGS